MKLYLRTLAALLLFIQFPVLAKGAERSSLVAAFLHATFHSPELSSLVHELIGEGEPMEKIAADGALTSPYQCTPELRPACFDAVRAAESGESGETVIHEWGEWDGLDDAMRARFVIEVFEDAAARGFNLLTEAEMAAAASAD